LRCALPGASPSSFAAFLLCCSTLAEPASVIPPVLSDHFDAAFCYDRVCAHLLGQVGRRVAWRAGLGTSSVAWSYRQTRELRGEVIRQTLSSWVRLWDFIGWVALYHWGFVATGPPFQDLGNGRARSLGTAAAATSEGRFLQFPTTKMSSRGRSRSGGTTLPSMFSSAPSRRQGTTATSASGTVRTSVSM
jgi:hypothetical protein